MTRYEELSDEQLEARIRRATLERALDLLTGGDDLPAGQLIALVGKLGIAEDKVVEEDGPSRSTADLFEILPGLPADRQEEILAEFEAKLKKAREESNG